ncbi:PREDICTED: thioredoxin-2 [Dinoponera quadriceps]|uniref:Thioredoxin-2 n=1 Tax=Dinoponera quadriceps TaxID=609295 RepID=A0A6P3YC77_DINQU|nr:PREDICTED: thioredoxin-2 [Dinoponera quadriceps]
MVHEGEVCLVQNSEDLVSKLEKAGDKLVVIDFFAVWCGPCKMIGPKMEELAKDMEDVVFLKVDVDECEEIAAEYKITSMPTFVFIKNSKVLETFSGANFDKLKNTILKHK